MKQAFLVAVAFLTRFPVTLPNGLTHRHQAQSLMFYPMVGLLIGGLLWVIAAGMQDTAPLLISAIVVGVWILATGGLHLDGLADCADGWVGGIGDQSKTRQIMKDPHVGAMAVVTLVMVLLMKVVALGEVLNHDGFAVLIVAPALARCSSIALFMTTSYVSANGLGSNLVDQFGHEGGISGIKNGRRYALWGTALVAFVVLGWSALWLIAVLTAVFLYLRHLAVKRLGGFTGDVAGAMIELIELAVCVTMALLM